MPGVAFRVGMNPLLRYELNPILAGCIQLSKVVRVHEYQKIEIIIFPIFFNVQARFKMTLHVPTDRVALSNMPVVEETKLSPKMKTVKFEETPLMSTYLVAVVVGELDFIEGHTQDGEVPEAGSNYSEYVRRNVQVMSSCFSWLYGTRKETMLRLSKLDKTIKDENEMNVCCEGTFKEFACLLLKDKIWAC
jgi:hypothetical protein